MNRLNTDAFGKIKRMVALTVPSGSQAILYDSQARGEARPDSDRDVLIVLNKDRRDQSENDINIPHPVVFIPHPVVFIPRQKYLLLYNSRKKFCENIRHLSPFTTNTLIFISISGER